MAGVWRTRVALGAVALVLLGGAVAGVRMWGSGPAVRSVAGPALERCRAAAPEAGVFAAAQPAPVTAARRWTRIVSATATPAAVVISESDVADEDLPGWPARLVGLDPATLAQRWEWTYPTDAG